MTPFLQHASPTELLALRQHICSMFYSNSLVYQRFTECLPWARHIEGAGNTAVIKSRKPFPWWNIYFWRKTHHKRNKEGTCVFCWVMIGTKKKQEEGKRKRKVEGGKLCKVALRKEVRKALSQHTAWDRSPRGLARTHTETAKQAQGCRSKGRDVKKSLRRGSQRAFGLTLKIWLYNEWSAKPGVLKKWVKCSHLYFKGSLLLD